MKPKYISNILLIAAMLFVIPVSCSKEENSVAVQKCVTPSCKIANEWTTTAYEIDANQWKGQGAYGCDFGPALKAASGSYLSIYNIHVIYGGSDYLLEDGQTISFLNGKLSLSGTWLSFNAQYNQLPFQSLHLIVNVN